MPDPSSLYPQPPSQQGNPLAGINPLQLIDTMQAMQLRNIQIQREQGQLPATVQQPGAALAGQNISNATAQLQQDAATSNILASHYATLANLENPTAADVHHYSTMATTLFPQIPASRINAFADSLLKDPRGVKHAASLFQTMAAGPAASMARTETTAPEGYSRGTAPLGAVNVAGSVPVGQPVGQETVQTGAAQRAQALQATATTSPQYHADLENLKQDSRVMENLGGPTVETEKKLAQLSARLGGLLPSTLSPEQLRATESFDKIASQISSTQAASLGAATDAGRHMVVGMNPSSSMSAYGREGVIDMLQGNQDTIDATRRAWLGSGLPGNQHDKWINEFGKQLDPRVFQFNRLSRENQQKFLSQIDPDEYPGFIQRWNSAVARGWVRPLKAQQPSPAEPPPLAGARKASDGKWYIPDHARPGKYLMVQ